MSKAPSILVLTSTYARSDDDPQVPWMRETNNRLTELGHDLEVLAPAFEGLKSHEIDGVKVNRFRYAVEQYENLTHDSGAPSKVQNPIVKLRTIPYLVSGFLHATCKLIKDRPDAIMVHWPFPHGLMAWLGARLSGTKIISICHGAELAIVRGSKPLQWVLSWCLRHSDLVYCNSSHTLAQIRSLPGCEEIPVEIVTYGSTVKETSEQAANSKTPLLLSCGRVIERKGYPYLIKAMPKVLEKFSDAKLVITSDGEMKPECERLIKELKLEQSVSMPGYISNQELSELYQTCTVYVHPSIIDSKGDTEGLGVVLVEALSHKKPVVASAVGGIVDVIKHEVSGILVPEKDSDALAEEIITLLENPEQAAELGEKGYQFGREHFSWHNIVTRLSGLIKKTVTGSASHHIKSVEHKTSEVRERRS